LYKQVYYEHKLEYLINRNFENYVLFSVLRCSVVWYVCTNISKDPVNISFRVEEQMEAADSFKKLKTLYKMTWHHILTGVRCQIILVLSFLSKFGFH